MKVLLLINIYLCNSQPIRTSYDSATPTPIPSFEQILLPTNTATSYDSATSTPIPSFEQILLPTNTPTNTITPFEQILLPTNTPKSSILPTNTPTSSTLSTNTPINTLTPSINQILLPTNTPISSTLSTNTPISSTLSTNTITTSVNQILLLTNTPILSILQTNTPISSILSTNTVTPSFYKILLPSNTPKPSILPTNTPLSLSNKNDDNKLLCTTPSELGLLPTDCKLNSNMYNNFIQNKSSLHQNQTQIIFDNLASLPPQEINDVIRQAGILTLSSLSQTPFQTETSAFNFYAKEIKPLDDHQITIPQFNMLLPSLNVSNVAISVISWTTNPYVSNQIIDTNVVSISLSNLTGSLLNTKSLSNPIQLSWNINNNYISLYNITCSNTTTINCPNSNLIYKCSENLTISCSNPTFSASCLYWNTSLLNWDNYGCYPVFANTTYITCNCSHLTDFSARLNAVYESNIIIFGSATEVYSISGLIKYMHFYIIFGSLGLFGFICFIIG